MLKKPSLDRNDGGADHLPSLGKKSTTSAATSGGGLRPFILP